MHRVLIFRDCLTGQAKPAIHAGLAQRRATDRRVAGRIHPLLAEVINVTANGHRETADVRVYQESPDPVAVLAALGLISPLRVTPVTGGADAAIWRVGYDGADYALRLLRAEQAATARREAVVMAA